MSPEQTGQDTEQKYNTRDYIGLWQVLYNDDEHGLQIISADIVANLTLGHNDSDGDPEIRTISDEKKAIEAYNNSINTLNQFCENYVNDKYATSGRSVGSNPLNPKDDINSEEDNSNWYKYDYGDNVAAIIYKGNINYEKDYEAMQKATSQNVDGIWKVNNNYWLASRMTAGGFTSQFHGISINVYYMDNQDMNTINTKCLFNYDNVEGLFPREQTCGVRPVIKLKEDVEIEGGNGSIDTAFILK